MSPEYNFLVRANLRNDQEALQFAQGLKETKGVQRVAPLAASYSPFSEEKFVEAQPLKRDRTRKAGYERPYEPSFIGSILMFQRLNQVLSQTELGEQLGGYSQASISYIEHGKMQFINNDRRTTKTGDNICRFLGIGSDDLKQLSDQFKETKTFIVNELGHNLRAGHFQSDRVVKEDQTLISILQDFYLEPKDGPLSGEDDVSEQGAYIRIRFRQIDAAKYQADGEARRELLLLAELPYDLYVNQLKDNINASIKNE
ncbi:helix-turn-helix transcriptional regulator [Candidatus Daviesbacteria bacterium]|nr:helix-turn-helix transcriptional regulator [Candidatus Daviesbacteria bacterium]